jgi:hypothetical protein
MSHFADICTQLTNALTLRQALEHLGFQVEAVEVPPNLSQRELNQIALHYRNSFSDTRKAHLIARHSELRQQNTAIGFLWNAATKTYDLQCDPYELRYSDLGKNWEYQRLDDAEIQRSLNQRIQLEHDHAYVRQQYPPDQYIITENKVDNGIQLTIKPKTQRVNIGSAV